MSINPDQLRLWRGLNPQIEAVVKRYPEISDLLFAISDPAVQGVIFAILTEPLQDRIDQRIELFHGNPFHVPADEFEGGCL